MKYSLLLCLTPIILFAASCNDKKGEYILKSIEKHSIDYENHNKNGSGALVAAFITDTTQYIAIREHRPSFLRYFKREQEGQHWDFSHGYKFDSLNNMRINSGYCFVASIDSIIINPIDSIHLYFVKHFNQDDCYEIYRDIGDMSKGFRTHVTNSYMVFIKDNIYVALHYNVHLSFKERYSQYPIGKFMINDNGKMENISDFGKYPDIYKHDYYYQERSPQPFLATDNNYLYATYAHDHNVYIYDDTILLDIKEVKSKDFDEFQAGSFTEGSNPTYLINYVRSNYYYYSFFHDPYRNLFYRQVLLPSPELIKNTPANSILQDWKLLIFDENLNLTGEHFFAGDVYRNYMKILPEGILIQYVYDKDNPYFFELFKIEKK